MKTKASRIFKEPMKNITVGLSLIICIAAILYACKKDDDKVTPDNGGSVEDKGVSAHAVATGLDTPWQIAFAPDGRIFFTERIGRVRVMENGQLNQTPYLNLRDSVIEAGESGLTGITIDPKFAENHYFYLAWSYEKSRNPFVIMNKIVRFREDPSTKTPLYDKVLLDSIEGYINHNVGSLHFGPDDILYIPVGERFIPEYAQDPKKRNGKILRITRDGSVPGGNLDPDSYVYTLGHRNVQGLAWQPGTDNLFNVEHGPSEEQGCCLDEINLIEQGKNYGWPEIRGAQQKAGMQTPIYNSGDTVTWAPCQNIFVTEGAWNGSMLFTGLFDKALHRAIFDPSDPKKVVKVETYLKDKLGRLRAIAKGPDGKIYISTSNGDGRGIAVTPEDDRILTLDLPK